MKPKKTDTPTTTEAPVTDEALFSMPEHGASAQEDGTPAPSKFAGLAREVKSEDELVEYARDLEKKAVEATLAASRTPQPTMATAQPPAPAAAESSSANDDDEELMYTNPKEFKRRLKEEAKSEIRQEQKKAEDAKSFWSKFYDANPDLRNADMVVQSVLREKGAEFANLPLAEGEKVLAAQARAVVAKIRGAEGTTTELTRTAAGTLPSSGGVPPVRKVAQEEPESFVAQVKKLQRRGA